MGKVQQNIGVQSNRKTYNNKIVMVVV